MVAVLEPRIGNSPAPERPRVVRWNNDQFHRAWDLGFFEGRTIILVDGELIEMPAPSPAHNATVGRLDYLLKKLFDERCWVRIQMGFSIGDEVDTVPDIAVVIGTPDDVDEPTSAELVVEVSESSFAYDFHEKPALYASAGVREYWVVENKARKVHVFREPVEDAASPRGYRYTSLQALGDGDTISPSAEPSAALDVSKFFPKVAKK